MFAIVVAERQPMTMTVILRVAGGGLVALIGAVLIAGSAQLHRGPEAWPDLVASPTLAHQAAAVMLALGLGAGAAGIAAAADVPWGRQAAMLVTLIVAIVAFWGNRVLFGGTRPAHMVTNVDSSH